MVAVVAAPRTGEGGERRPKGPTGGKAPSSRAFRWVDTRERLCAHQSCHQTPIGRQQGAAAALLEEPDACMAHVRVCGGCAKQTGREPVACKRHLPNASPAGKHRVLHPVGVTPWVKRRQAVCGPEQACEREMRAPKSIVVEEADLV